MAPRSGLEPECARRARLLALGLLLLSACLNPMPEEFPSNTESVVNVPGTSGGSVDDGEDRPTAPGENDTGGDLFGGDVGSGGSGGSSGNVIPPAAEPPVTGSDGDGEAEAPDAGADAGTTSATGTDDTRSEGDTAP